jgi:hypothetical protein
MDLTFFVDLPISTTCHARNTFLLNHQNLRPLSSLCVDDAIMESSLAIYVKKSAKLQVGLPDTSTTSTTTTQTLENLQKPYIVDIIKIYMVCLFMFDLKTF